MLNFLGFIIQVDYKYPKLTFLENDFLLPHKCVHKEK